MNDQQRRRAVFLDRDGTINVEKDYLFKAEDFEFIPGAPEAIARLNQAGLLVIVVTNQSGVAQGFFSIDDVHRLHHHIRQALLPFDATIDAFYICPHHPQKGIETYRMDCGCRKGHPGMLQQAADDLNVDLQGSFMIGDKDTDLLAGIAAGCRNYLVRTGYGENHVAFATENNVPVVATMGDAVNKILEQADQLM